jgi:structural maintenance of chromosome 3 (chondroitin sulfate proteoglycan 6)
MSCQNLARGLATAKQIAQELGLTGYYGPLIELFECTQAFHLAVEMTAGNSLFDIVVDTDQTAARLIAELNRRQGGRITCVPLNTIKPKEREYPNDNVILPMIKHITFDPAVRKAMMQVFGRTVITRNLDIADKAAISHKLNGITLTGDRVDRRGAMSGGSADIKRTRIATQEIIRQASASLEDTEQKLAQVKDRQNQIDAEMNKLDTDLLKAADSRHKVRDHFKALEAEIRDLKREAQDRKTKMEHNVRSHSISKTASLSP